MGKLSARNNRVKRVRRCRFRSEMISEPDAAMRHAMRSQRNPVRFTTAARATVEPSVAGPIRHPAADADETP